jgi:hypothetical protein
LFGSGAMHSPYALFIAQSKLFNGGRKVGLIRAAETRMAGHAYAQCRMLRLRGPLVATIGSAAYQDLKLPAFTKKVESYLLNSDMWEATYLVQRCLYPMIRCLRLGDKGSCGGMSKIMYYIHKTDKALETSIPLLANLKYFEENVEEDASDVEGLDSESDDDSDADDDDDVAEDVGQLTLIDSDDEAEEEPLQEEETLGEKIALYWKHRRRKLITPLALAGWYCSPHPDIRQDVLDNEGDGTNRFEVEKVIAKMYFPIRDAELGQLCNQFWTEFNLFQTKQGPSYSREHIWDSDEIINGQDHVWHKLYSKPYHKVFGSVACRACSKPLGCGNAERNWGNLKHLKSGKRSHLSADKARKQATIYGAASMEKARAMQELEEANGNIVEYRWTDADVGFDLGLEDWNRDNAGGNLNVPSVVVPKRLFNAWIEDWEWDTMMKNDIVAMTRLLQKYGGLHWQDPDNNNRLLVALVDDMQWSGRGHGGNGWCVLGRKENDETESWVIHLAIDEMAEYDQPAELNLEIVVNDELREANRIRIEAEEEERRKKRRRR